MYQLIDKVFPWIVYATGDKEYCKSVQKRMTEATRITKAE